MKTILNNIVWNSRD